MTFYLTKPTIQIFHLFELNIYDYAGNKPECYFSLDPSQYYAHKVIFEEVLQSFNKMSKLQILPWI